MKHTIDASGKSIGRVATEAAVLLMGKHSADFARNAAAVLKVEITNASKAKISEKKMDSKTYSRYSGYPGGLKTLSLRQVAAQLGFQEVFKDAVYGMLPSNKLRPTMMKNLIITE